MKTIKQKYAGMTKPDLTKAVTLIEKKIYVARISAHEEPKNFGVIQKLKYERALVKTLLSIPEKS